MKKSIQLFLLATMTLLFQDVWSQGILSSVAPMSGANGSTIEMVIHGAGTKFNNTSILSIGGVNIVPMQITVQDQENMRIRFNLAGFTQGDYPLMVITNGVPTQTIFFKVFEAGSELNVMVNVMPIQSITVSDLDPKNLANSPILFTVNIMNDATNRPNLFAKLTISAEMGGEIGTATKNGINLASNSTFIFNNKEFSEYKVNTANSNFFEKAIKSGTLPSDIYTYTIEIFNETDKIHPIGKGSGKNVIVNQITKPELISPGNDFSRPQEALRMKQPLFQWFSQGNNFEFSLYPINAGQRTPEEITLNRPVLRISGIKTSSFQYPASAEMLEEGKSYAWQIKYISTGSGGNQVIASEVFWFKYTAAGAVQLTVSDIKLSPEDSYVQINQTKQFTAEAFSINNEPVKNAKIEWKVVPADAGSISNTGLFTANAKLGSCAIIAKVGDVQEYATVNVVNVSASDWSMKEMLQKLFGLPKK